MGPTRGFPRRRRPSDPTEAPVIHPNFLSTESDRIVAVEAVRLTRRIVEQPAMARFSPSEFRAGSSVQKDDDIVRAVGDISTTAFHPVGTGAMGGVADSDLRVFGTEALRVVEGVAIPRDRRGNTNGAVIAEKAADILLGKGPTVAER